MGRLHCKCFRRIGKHGSSGKNLRPVLGGVIDPNKFHNFTLNPIDNNIGQPGKDELATPEIRPLRPRYGNLVKLSQPA